ncbi:11543_t:CDS:2 [Dentiscutata erythropus]|uniref:11543_t:CDS:1 n=1 Tax=Dentiscutata erythropus TaxID=1348616 RepID=A0A9N9NVY9_9GLOM|nr:11543_t:CDS:2 [Dentiscutata erythropus]
MQPQKRTKAQREALRKRRESAAIFNRLNEDTSINFLSENIDDFSRTFFDDGFDDSLTANTSTETAKNNIDVDKMYDFPSSTETAKNNIDVDKIPSSTEQLRITEKAMNSLANFKEIASKFNAPLQSQMNASCSTPKATLPILSSHDAIRSISHNLYSPIGVHRASPLKDHGNLLNLPDEIDNFEFRICSSSSSTTNSSTDKNFDLTIPKLPNKESENLRFRSEKVDQGLGTPNVFSSNYHSNSSMTSRGEHKKTRASNLRPPTSLSRLKPPIQRRLNSVETAFHAMNISSENNSSEDNRSASNLPGSRILRATSVRPKK